MRADRQFRDRFERTGRPEAAESSSSAILALQRSAGNRAVTGLLQRSAEPDDVAAQEKRDADSATIALLEGMALIRSFQRRQAPADAPPTPLATPGPVAQGGEIDLGEPEEEMEVDWYEEEESAESEAYAPEEQQEQESGSPMEDDARPPAGGARGTLMRATARGEIGPHAALPIPGLTAAAAWSSPTRTPNKAPRFRRGNRSGAAYARSANRAARRAKMDRLSSLHTFPIGGAARETPLHWAEFLALLGGTGNKKRWVQGHFMHRSLGGPGTMKNLAPFTYSLNAVHFGSVEKHVIDAVKAGTVTTYSVHALPGGDTQNHRMTLQWYGDLIRSAVDVAMAAMTQVGTISGQEAAYVLRNGPSPALADNLNPGGTRTLQDAVTATEQWIAAYITDAFPAEIVCRARYYDPQTGAKQVGEVRIDNTI